MNTGYEPEELLGKSPFEFIHPDDKKRLFPILKSYVNANIKKLLTGKELPATKRIEFRFKDKEENWRDFQSTGNIVGNQLLFISRDITDQKKTEEALRKRQQEFTSLFKSNPEALVYLDEKGTILDANLRFCKLFGYSLTITAYVIKTGKSLLNDNNQYEEMVTQGILNAMGSTTPQNVWLEVPLKVEDRVIGAMAIQSYTNPNIFHEEDIKIMEFVSSQVATAIERKKTEEKFKHLSFHDSLTGLYNRAYFEEELERFNFPRYYPLSIVMLDVNGLKVINDTFGHSEGDRLLKHLSQILISVSRQGDIVARIGGDEFAILLPYTSSEEAYKFCERIKQACQQDKIEPIYLRPNISLGYTIQEGEYKDTATLLKEADKKMYQDKLFNGKSREKHFLEAFRIILAERDPHTSDHAQRLQELSLSLGQRVGLTEYQLGNLKLLALLHDIGKIGIPDSILFKTYILTSSERKNMREHPRIGYRMAKNIPDFALIAQEILYHHEYWDGIGYPEGLKGEKIPLLSRIISIVDAYDVMQSCRPYKEPLSKAEALKEIKRYAGTQFDPQLVEIFLKIVKT
ncbi:MAG TPA: diguanylate cyclase [Candidatus Atribacteria bacterium]|nr:diguanylate cyclase [Candidatus Atribacteria bacterium]